MPMFCTVLAQPTSLMPHKCLERGYINVSHTWVYHKKNSVSELVGGRGSSAGTQNTEKQAWSISVSHHVVMMDNLQKPRMTLYTSATWSIWGVTVYIRRLEQGNRKEP